METNARPRNNPIICTSFRFASDIAVPAAKWIQGSQSLNAAAPPLDYCDSFSGQGPGLPHGG